MKRPPTSLATVFRYLRIRYCHAQKSLHRFRRFVSSGSPILFAGGVALAGLAFSRSSTFTNLNRWAVILLLIGWIGLLLFQMTAEYKRRTYDPKLMLEFDRKFDSPTMRSTRSRAAKALRNNRGSWRDFKSLDTDDILDFFENIGYFMQGDEITPEVAHSAFFHWIHGYYYATRKYLEAAREKEPSQWEFIEYLFKMTRQIDLERIARHAKQPTFTHLSEIKKFLDEEIQLEQQGVSTNRKI